MSTCTTLTHQNICSFANKQGTHHTIHDATDLPAKKADKTYFCQGKHFTARSICYALAKRVGWYLTVLSSEFGNNIRRNLSRNKDRLPCSPSKRIYTGPQTTEAEGFPAMIIPSIPALIIPNTVAFPTMITPFFTSNMGNSQFCPPTPADKKDRRHPRLGFHLQPADRSPQCCCHSACLERQSWPPNQMYLAHPDWLAKWLLRECWPVHGALLIPHNLELLSRSS
jgi:hypothetical protein